MSNLIDLDDPENVPPSKALTALARNDTRAASQNVTLRQRLEELRNVDTSSLSHEDALSLAIAAAEIQMHFMRLASTKSQQKILSDRSHQFLNQAERIKQTVDWDPKLQADLLDFHPIEPSPSVATEGRSSATLVGSKSQSTRELTPHENLILWRASTLHDCGSRPWDESNEPTTAEFESTKGHSQFEDKTPLRLSDSQARMLEGWLRPHQALPPPNVNVTALDQSSYLNLKPTMHRVDRTDLVQDAATDCSLVASLCAAVARAEKGHPRIISNIIYPHSEDGTPLISPNGRYVVKLNFNGCFRKVVIDDRLPVSKNARIMHVVDRNNPSLLWPALIEKAYLKIRGGYDFPGSNSGTDLWILTGWIPEQVFLNRDTTEAADLWQKIKESFSTGDVLVTIGTSILTEKTEAETGLVGSHDYAILDYDEDKDSRQSLLIKNPWLKNKARQIHTLYKGTANSRGTFWMSLHEVMQNFDSMYLNWNPAIFTHRADVHFYWDLSPESGAQSPEGSLITHPQFVVGSEKGDTIWLLLSKHFRDRPKANGPSRDENPEEYISLSVFQSGGKRVSVSRHSEQTGLYVDSPDTLMHLDVAPGVPYTVVPSQDMLAQIKHTFSLFVFSHSRLTLSGAPSRFSERNTVHSRWTVDNAGGNGNSPTYAQNPQFTLRLRSKSPICILLETLTKDLYVNVRLVHGRGKRVAAVSARDIIADSADYRPNYALAELVGPLDAGTYTIICGTFEAGQTGDFTLHVEADVPVELNAIERQGAGRVKIPLADASFSPDVRRLACPLTPLRLARLFLNAYMRVPHSRPGRLSAAGHASSPIRVAIEQGYGPQRYVLIASAGGQFSDAPGGVLTEDVDLQPSMVDRRTRTDMWLVCERMAGTGGVATAEERVRVEVYADVDEPVEVGVWRPMD